MQAASLFAPPGSSLQHALAMLDRDFPESSVTVDGQVLSYRSCGKGPGPAVVLLHGIGSGAASWLPCALALAGKARVIAWNAPGYGGSDALPASHPKADEYAARLHQLLGALEAGPVILVGHSLGALVAAAYADRYGATLARLVLLSPARGYAWPERQQQGRRVEQERLATLAALGVSGMAQQRAGRLLSDQATQAQRDWVQWNMAQLRDGGYVQAVRLLCGDAIEHYAPRAGSAAVYCGSADTITTPQDCRAAAVHFRLPFGFIRDAGHACYIEQAAATAEAILSTTIN